MGISSWPASERPRERLLAKGAGALTDAELIAVLLRTGVRGKSAVDLAREMIERFKGVKGLLAPAADLQAIKGLGARSSKRPSSSPGARCTSTSPAARRLPRRRRCVTICAYRSRRASTRCSCASGSMPSIR